MKKLITYFILFITLFLGVGIESMNAEYKITNDFLKTTRYAQSVLDNYYKKLDANISNTERKIQKLELLVDKINAIENRYKNSNRQLSEQSTLLLLAMKQDIINQIRLYRYVYQRDQKDLYIYDILDDDFNDSRYPYIDDDYNDNIPDYDYTDRYNVIRDYNYRKTYRNTDDREIKLAEFYIKDNAYNNATLDIKLNHNSKYVSFDDVYLRSDNGQKIYASDDRSNTYYTFKRIKNGARYSLYADIDITRANFDTTISTRVDDFNGGTYSRNLTLGEVRIDNDDYYTEDDEDNGYDNFINYNFTNTEDYYSESKYYKIGRFNTKNIRNNDLRIKIKNTNNLQAIDPYLLNGNKKIYLSKISESGNYITYKIPTLRDYENYNLYVKFERDYNTLNTESIYVYLIGDYSWQKNISHIKIKHRNNNENNNRDKISYYYKTYDYTINDDIASDYYQIGAFNTLNLNDADIYIKIKESGSISLENPYVIESGSKRYLSKISVDNRVTTYKLSNPRSNTYYKIYAKANNYAFSHNQNIAQVYINVNNAWETQIAKVIFDIEKETIVSGAGYNGTIYGGIKRNSTYKIGQIDTSSVQDLEFRVFTNVETLYAKRIYLKNNHRTIFGDIGYDTVSFDNVPAGEYSLYAIFDRDNDNVRKIEVKIESTRNKGAVIGTVNFPFNY